MTVLRTDSDRRAHPRVNAALPLRNTRGQRQAAGRRAVDLTRGGDEDVCRTGRFRDKVWGGPRSTLGCRGWIVRQPVQSRDEPAAEVGDLRKGVCFAAAVLELQRSSALHWTPTRVEPPRGDEVIVYEIGDEVTKRRAALAYAGARPRARGSG